jgi:hypothetical protein
MAQKAARPMIYHELNAKSDTSQTMVGADLFITKVIEFQNFADPCGYRYDWLEVYCLDLYEIAVDKGSVSRHRL